VIGQANENIPVFQVLSESGKARTLHRNHLRLVIDQDKAESRKEEVVKSTPVEPKYVVERL